MTLPKILARALLVLLLAGGASASPFRPLVDFRAGGSFQPSGPTDWHHVDLGGVSMIVEAMSLGGGREGTLHWDADDGYGIRGPGYENDEIESPEALRISFSSAIAIERILLSDLFLEVRKGTPYAEQGSYSLDGGSSWTTFWATAPDPNGDAALLLPSGTRVRSILFTAPGRTRSGSHEFSVAGFDSSSLRQGTAPEPGAALLFGAGLALLTGWRRGGLTAPAGAGRPGAPAASAART